ncbi:DNA-binding protein inhibitor ID-2 isoform X2 [Pan troglodytes]|uniref:DNA-binding protein inhibitor ID-2 isoform X2 n=1 Tax=Pan troglodytes TaxID=9598 RepID=UPI00301360C6
MCREDLETRPPPPQAPPAPRRITRGWQRRPGQRGAPGPELLLITARGPDARAAAGPALEADELWLPPCGAELARVAVILELRTAPSWARAPPTPRGLAANAEEPSPRPAPAPTNGSARSS